MEIRTTWNLVQNEIQNARIHNLESAPDTPVEGQVYFNSSVGNKAMYYWNGTSWIRADTNPHALVGANHTASGLTAGYVIRATGATTFAWQQLSYNDLSNLPTYDNYVSWNLKTNGTQRIAVVSGGTLDIVAGTGMTVGYSAGGVVTVNSSWTKTGSDIYYNTGNVGINVTPNYKLHVNSNTIYFENSGSTTTNVYVKALDTYNAVLRYYSGTDFWSTRINGTTNAFEFRYNGVDKIFINTSGQFGIGAAPSYPLHVTVTGTTGMKLTGDGSSAYYIHSGDGNVSRIRYTSDGDAHFRIRDDDAGVDRLSINESGEVGIGVDPSEKLTVKSPGNSSWVISAQRSSDTNRLGGFYQSATGDGLLYLYDSANNSDIRLHTGGDSYFTGGNVGIGTDSPTGLLHLNSTGGDTNLIVASDATLGNDPKVIFREGAATNKYTIYEAAAKLHFAYGAGAGTIGVTFDSTGNVGIGTASPDTKLHLHDTGTGSVFTKYSNADTGEGATDGMIVGIGAGEHGNIWHYDAYDLIFGTSNTERMRILSGGNVGIGITPTTKLQVAGSTANKPGLQWNDSVLRIGESETSLSGTGFTNKGVEIGYSATNDYGRIISYDRGISSYKALRIGGNNVTIYDGGTLVADFGATLVSVTGQIKATTQVNIDSAGSAYSIIDRGGIVSNDAYTWYKSVGVSKWLAGIGVSGGEASSDDYRITDGSTTRFLIKRTTGNIGIRTNNPLAPLEVKSYDVGETVQLWTASDGSTIARVYEMVSGEGLLQVHDAGGTQQVSFRGDGGNNYVIGKLGIGTKTPATSALLDLTSTTGVLLLSRMTTVQRNALTAVNGMFLYNTTDDKFQGYENGAWVNLI